MPPPDRRPRAWPESAFRNPLFRALLRHQFWRKALARIGPRLVLAPVGRLKMYLDLGETLGVSRYILKHGRYDPWVSGRMAGWIGPRGSAIDVGANIGYHTLLAASRTGGTVWAIEPEPWNFRLLTANIELNGLRNVRAVPKAAGERAETLRLHMSGKNSGDHRLFAGGEERAWIDVPVVPLDEELAGAGPIAFVKVDVQGFEERVARGMRRILTANPRIVVVSEFEPKSIVASGAEPGAYLDFMESLGFRWRVVREDRAEPAEMGRDELLALCGPRGLADLVFSRD